jgi:hypothetical protein
MHASMRANLLCRKIPADVRIGFDRARARDFQWLFTDERIPPVQGEHALEAMMGFARYIGAQPTDLRWDIPIGESEQAFAAEYARQRTVVISPCSSQRSRNFRNWPVEHFVTVTRHLRDRLQANVVLTGGNSPLEKEYARIISQQAGASDLVGQTSLKQLFALIAAADVVVCPDSGPAHMATAAGTPVIGLYATSNPDRTGPYLSRAPGSDGINYYKRRYRQNRRFLQNLVNFLSTLPTFLCQDHAIRNPVWPFWKRIEDIAFLTDFNLFFGVFRRVFGPIEDPRPSKSCSPEAWQIHLRPGIQSQLAVCCLFADIKRFSIIFRAS